LLSTAAARLIAKHMANRQMDTPYRRRRGSLSERHRVRRDTSVPSWATSGVFLQPQITPRSLS